MKCKLILLSFVCLLSSGAFSQTTFNGLDMNLGNLQEKQARQVWRR
jgi:hypothetical protein